MTNALRWRVCMLLLLHFPSLLLWWFGVPLFALLLMLTLHATLLWATFYPHSRLSGPVLSRLPADRQQVWLTIDDGPSVDTLAILALLERFHAKATFFLVGTRAQANPELARAIVQAGHEIGNHSATHPSAWFWVLPPRRMRRELVQAQQILNEITGSVPRWFRSVVGHTNPFVTPVLRGMNLKRVSWTARAFDAVDGNVARVAAKLLQQLKPGAIVLLHEGATHGHSVAIIETVLEGLAARGYAARLP